MNNPGEPVFVVKLCGIVRDCDMERYYEKFDSKLPGRVIMVDSRVEDIYKLTEQDVTKLVRVLEGKVDQ